MEYLLFDENKLNEKCKTHDEFTLLNSTTEDFNALPKWPGKLENVLN